MTVGTFVSEFWPADEDHLLLRVLGLKPVVVDNILVTGSSYRELIPTKHFKGTEAAATQELFSVGARLARNGFAVKRLKIEGDPSMINPGRALYYEAHMKNLDPARLKVVERFRSSYHLSRNLAGEDIWTVRAPYFSSAHQLAALVLGDIRCEVQRIEACVLDTAPELDNAWMRRAA